MHLAPFYDIARYCQYLLVENRQSKTPTSICHPRWVWSRWNFAEIFDLR